MRIKIYSVVDPEYPALWIFTASILENSSLEKINSAFIISFLIRLTFQGQQLPMSPFEPVDCRDGPFTFSLHYQNLPEINKIRD